MEDFIIEDRKLIKYTGNDSDIIIPVGVEAINSNSINIKNIKSITIPSTVRRIGELSPCIKDGYHTIYSQDLNSKPTIYFDCNLNEYLHIYNDSAYLFNRSCEVMIKRRGKFICLQTLEEVKIPDDIRYFDNNLCYCGLKKVIFGKNLKYIHSSFFMCKNLEEIVFNERLEVIGESAFSDCTSIGPTLCLPNSVKGLGFHSFKNCEKLETIYIGKDFEIAEHYNFVSAFDEISHKVHIINSETKEEAYTIN